MKLKFGISENDGIYCLDPTCGNHCCLIGAFLLNKKIYVNPKSEFSLIYDTLCDNYKLKDPDEYYALYHGFDRNDENVPKQYEDTYSFGLEVSKILFGE